MNTIKKAIIFDRDGVLNKDKGYIHSWDELEWIDGAREAVARLTEDGWLLFVATNQSGVQEAIIQKATFNCFMNK